MTTDRSHVLPLDPESERIYSGGHEDEREEIAAACVRTHPSGFREEVHSVAVIVAGALVEYRVQPPPRRRRREDGKHLTAGRH